MAQLYLTVIDDFLPNPKVVREQALRTPIDVTGGNPGLSSHNIDVDKHMTHIGKLLKITPDYEHLQHIALFRMTRGNDPIVFTDIHRDGPVYAGVCYLNPPRQCSGGTSFFRHRRTGLDRWPTRSQTKSLIAAGKMPRRASGDKGAMLWWEEEGRDRSKWDEILRVPMVYNRALFYYGNQFHSMTSWSEFGRTKATARMTMVYHFHEL
jgi:hypothetical protein